MTIADDPRQLSNDQLAERIRTAASEQTAHQAWWFSLIAEFDQRNGHLEFGMRSCAEFLSWWCGLDPRTARDQLRVIRKLPGLPLVRAEFEAGRLTYSKVRALTRAADANNESMLVSLAGDLTATQLERVVGALESSRQVLTQDDDDRRRTQCGVIRWVDAMGLVHHEVMSAPEQAGVVDAALGFGVDNLFQEAKAAAKAAKAAKASGQAAGEMVVPMPGRTASQRRLDSLLWVLQRGLVNAQRSDLVPTNMDNLRPRCSFHHHLVHEGGWREVLGVDGRTVLIRPDGTRQIGPTPSSPRCRCRRRRWSPPTVGEACRRLRRQSWRRSAAVRAASGSPRGACP